MFDKFNKRITVEIFIKSINQVIAEQSSHPILNEDEK